jgi:recombination protein U
MGINRGKQFEDTLQEQFEKLDNLTITRLYDVTMGYYGVNNPCDFIIYRFPNILYLECKAVHGNTLNFKSDIKENQWDKLLEYSKVNGVNAGIICWYIDWDITVFLPIEYLQYMLENSYKSFNVRKDMNKIPRVILNGKKKRVFFEYDLERFMEEISYE